jgi:hypothetical protein
MAMFRRCITGVIVLLFLLAPTGAGAATHIVDARGDNYTPGYDITHVRYTNRPGKIVSTVWMTRLPERTYADFQIASGSFRMTYGVVVKKVDGRVRGQFWRYAVEGPGQRIACDVTVSWTTAKKTIRVSVPSSCLDMKRSVVKMTTYISRRGARTWSDASPTRKVWRG